MVLLYGDHLRGPLRGVGILRGKPPDRGIELAPDYGGGSGLAVRIDNSALTTEHTEERETHLYDVWNPSSVQVYGFSDLY